MHFSFILQRPGFQPCSDIDICKGHLASLSIGLMFWVSFFLMIGGDCIEPFLLPIPRQSSSTQCETSTSGQGQEEDGCQDKSPYGAGICNLDLIISQLDQALPFIQQIPSQADLGAQVSNLIPVGTLGEQGNKVTLCCFQNQFFFSESRTALYGLNLARSSAFSSWKWFLLFPWEMSAKLLRIRHVKCVCVCVTVWGCAGWCPVGEMWNERKKIHCLLGGFFVARALPDITSFNSQDSPER